MEPWWTPLHEHAVEVREKVKADRGSECGICLEKIPGRTYHWCTLCNWRFHDKCGKRPIEIKHFFHPCPLLLRRRYDGFTCNSCFVDHSKAFSYRCSDCDFDMCVECAAPALLSMLASHGQSDKEQVLHCCHRHPLQPLPSYFKSELCEICTLPCSSTEDNWGCVSCSFYLHKICLDLLPEIVQADLSSQIVPWTLRTSRSKTCIDCNQNILSNLGFRGGGATEAEYPSYPWTLGPSPYLCIFCCLFRRQIGEPSSKYPKLISHFFHPCSDLKLKFSPSSTCDACFLNPNHLFYYCNRCEFFLCFDCAHLPQLVGHKIEANDLVLHFCHWHPLKLFTGTRGKNHVCNFCESNDFQPLYSCNNLCQFYIHKSCMDFLPHRTDHRLLNQTLVLRHASSFQCTTCNRQFPELTFYYSERKSKFCVKCVLWPKNELGDDGRFKSIFHWHRLSLHEIRIEERRRTCFLCKEQCIAWTWSYKCSECVLFFHKSCAELPAKLKHPIHPEHCLTLTNRHRSKPNEDMTCNLCLKSLSKDFPVFDLVYQCDQCSIHLDTQCASNRLVSLEYGEHPHPLYLVDKMHGNINCQVCGQSCKDSCTIHCAGQECDYSLHLQCGPLPCMIKHACHIHPLILKEYYVEDNGSDEFACHICEEERNPRLRVYCCSQDCLMICDVNCALYEVLPLLRGERGVVDLRTPYPHQVACRVMVDKSDIGEFKLDSPIEGNGDGVFHVERLIFEYQSQKTQEEEEVEEDKEEEDDDETSYSFTLEALSSFKKSLRAPNGLRMDLGMYWESITTGPYALPVILGPIYQEFFGTYNIIDDKCKLNYAIRRFYVFITCCILHQMRTIKVVDVTKDLILQWLGWIRRVEKRSRFNVGVIAENIKQVWEAHYYIKSRQIVEDETLRLGRTLEQVSMYKAELRTKIDELMIKMDEAEEIHTELERLDKEHDNYRVSGSRGAMKRVRSNALDIKWRSCFDALVTYPGNLPTK